MNSAETEPVDFRSSVELILSGDPDGLFNAANDLTPVSKSEAVEVLYRLAIEQGVKEAHLNYGLFLRDINRPKDALVQFEKAHAVEDQLKVSAPPDAYCLLRVMPSLSSGSPFPASFPLLVAVHAREQHQDRTDPDDKN